MTDLSGIRAGSRILAAQIAGVAPMSAYKAANQSVASSAALQADDALLITLAPNAVYMFIANLVYVGGTQGASDLHWGWSLPSGGVMSYQAVGLNPSGASMVGSCYTQTSGGAAGTTTGTRSLTMFGTVGTAAIGGSMQLEWAQNTSNATATTVGAGSVLAAWQVV